MSTNTSLALSGHPEADELLAKDPLALLIGMVLDQQVPLEWAFLGPFTLTQRLGHNLDAAAANVWRSAKSGDELRRRIEGLPGFGAQKSRIFVALLGKQLNVQPPGWIEAAGDYGQPGVYRSVADIVDPDSLARVRAYKQEKKAAAKAATQS